MTVFRLRNPLHTINAVLFVTVVAVGLYLVSAPWLMDGVYYLKTYLRKDKVYSYKRSTDLRSNDIEQVQLFEGEVPPSPGENSLFIPKIGVQSVTLEGNSTTLLNKGIWHRPNTSTPELGSNTVFVAHRFMYTAGPNTFYHLDKLAAGDRFAVWWNGKRYEYEVYESKIVPPTQLDIERSTPENIVTLWTCTPIFSSQNRLVVLGKLTKRSL